MHKKCGWRSWWRTTSWPRPTQSVVAKFTWAAICQLPIFVIIGVVQRTLFRSIGRHCNQWRSQQVGMGAIDRKSPSTQSWDWRPFSACKFSAALVATRRRDTRRNSLANWREVESFSRRDFHFAVEPAMSAVVGMLRLRAPTAARAASMSVRGMAKKCECCLVLCLVCPDELPPRRMVACKCCEWAESSGRSDITQGEKVHHEIGEPHGVSLPPSLSSLSSRLTPL
jgi:hypothetical protein